MPPITKPRPLLTRPSVVVLREKHDSTFLVAMDEAELKKVALAVLEFRQRSGLYDHLVPPMPKDPGFVEGDIAGLVPAIRVNAETVLRQYRREKSYRAVAEELARRIALCIYAKDGVMAWKCLMDLSDREYEQVDLHPLTSPESLIAIVEKENAE